MNAVILSADIANFAINAIRLLIPLFCVSTMFAMGLDITFAETLAPLRNLLAVGIIVLVNNVVVPLVGFVILAMPILLTGGLFGDLVSKVVPLEGGQKIGFLLLLLAAGSLLGPTLAKISGAKMPCAKGAMVVLAFTSALLVPMELELLCGFRGLSESCAIGGAIGSGAVFTTLLLYQLLPLVIGIFVKTKYDAIAVRLRPLILILTGLAFLLLLVLIVPSGQALGLAPQKVVVVQTEVFTATVPLTVTTDLDVGAVSNKLGNEFKDRGLTLPVAARAEVLSGGKRWAIVDPDQTYSVQVITPGVTPTLSITKTGSITVEFVLGDTKTYTQELNSRQISGALRDEFLGRGFALTSDLVVVIVPNSRWALVAGDKTYFVELANAAQDGEVVLRVYQESTQPQAIVAELMKSLEALASFKFGPILSLLTQIIVILVPYVMLAAVAAVLMLLGNYGGSAVRSITARNAADAASTGIPRALATSTTVRNVSMALILASEVFVSDWSRPDSREGGIQAIAMVLVFYLICLIVAARQAVQWGKEAAPPPAVG